MLVARHDESQPAKGWYTNLFHPALPAIGFANAGINEPHFHRELHEVYLVARGQSTVQIDREQIVLRAGDVLVVEPHEVHTFLDHTPDYFHFVLHCPRIQGDKAAAVLEP